MKKLILIVVAVMLAVAMLPSVAMADVSIDKSLSQSTASLGDHITVTLVVNASEGPAPVTVVDTLPDPLKYIAATLSVTGGDYTSTTSEDEIVCTLTDDATYTITFDVQVTSTEDEEFDVTNTATVYKDLAQVGSASATLTIEPYAGFEKSIEDCSELDPYNVPTETDVHWWVGIYVENIDGDDIEDMEDVVVKDRLGGDLELDEVEYVDGTTDDSYTTGKTEKVHLIWSEIGDLEDEDGAYLLIEISTDVNTGRGTANNPGNSGKNPKGGHQEYTDDVCTEHELNSGAVLKFIDPDTGFQLSAHTPPITVTAHVPGCECVY